MKRFRFLFYSKSVFSVSMLCLFCSYASHIQVGFKIDGQLTGLKDGTHLYLVRNVNQHADTVARVISNGDRFTFSGHVPKAADFYFIKIDTSLTKYEFAIKDYISVLLDNSDLTLSGSILDLSATGIKVTGSASENDFLSYAEYVDSPYKNIQEEFARFREEHKTDSDFTTQLRLETRKMNEDMNRIIKEWGESHPNSLLTPWLFQTAYSDLNDLETAYARLGDEARKSKLGLDLKNEIDKRKRTADGKIAPNFSFRTLNGRKLILWDEVGKAKLTLIDFWASWCGPCRATVPKMKMIYRKYHAQGLNIIGYSVDQQESAWRQAALHDSLPWVCVREEYKLADSLYNVSAIPMIVLLDKHGAILFKTIDTQGPELEKRIVEYLGD